MAGLAATLTVLPFCDAAGQWHRANAHEVELILTKVLPTKELKVIKGIVGGPLSDILELELQPLTDASRAAVAALKVVEPITGRKHRCFIVQSDPSEFNGTFIHLLTQFLIPFLFFQQNRCACHYWMRCTIFLLQSLISVLFYIKEKRFKRNLCSIFAFVDYEIVRINNSIYAEEIEHLSNLAFYREKPFKRNLRTNTEEVIGLITSQDLEFYALRVKGHTKSNFSFLLS
jgi:hypothetical protein